MIDVLLRDIITVDDEDDELDELDELDVLIDEETDEREYNMILLENVVIILLEDELELVDGINDIYQDLVDELDDEVRDEHQILVADVDIMQLLLLHIEADEDDDNELLVDANE